MTKDKKAASQATNPRGTASKLHYNYNPSPNKHEDQTSISALFNAGDNSTASERFRILRYLQLVGPATALQFRHLLDETHPGGMVFDHDMSLKFAPLLINLVAGFLILITSEFVIVPNEVTI